MGIRGVILDTQNLIMYNKIDKLHESKAIDYFEQFKIDIITKLNDVETGLATSASKFLKDLDIPKDAIPDKLKKIIDGCNDMKVILTDLDPLCYEVYIIQMHDKQVCESFDGNAAFIRTEYVIQSEDVDNDSCTTFRTGFIIVDNLNPSIVKDEFQFILKHEIAHATIDFMVYKNLLPKEEFEYVGTVVRDDLEFFADYMPIWNAHMDFVRASVDHFVDYIQKNFKDSIQDKYKPFIKDLMLYYNNSIYV